MPATSSNASSRPRAAREQAVSASSAGPRPKAREAQGPNSGTFWRQFADGARSSRRFVCREGPRCGSRHPNHPNALMFKIFDLLNGSRLTAPYAESCLANGVAAIHITLNNFQGINPVPDLRHSLNQLANYRSHLRTLDGLVRIVESFDDFERARADKKLAVVMGYQNVPGVERDLNLLRLFHDAGVRVIQIAHNIRNLYGDGCAEPADAGLSSLGRELVVALNELGIVIDLSHVGDRSGVEATKLSRQPVAV